MKPEQELQAAAVLYARCSEECVSLHEQESTLRHRLDELEREHLQAADRLDEAKVQLCKAALAFKRGLT